MRKGVRVWDGVVVCLCEVLWGGGCTVLLMGLFWRKIVYYR